MALAGPGPHAGEDAIAFDEAVLERGADVHRQEDREGPRAVEVDGLCHSCQGIGAGHEGGDAHSVQGFDREVAGAHADVTRERHDEKQSIEGDVREARDFDLPSRKVGGFGWGGVSPTVDQAHNDEQKEKRADVFVGDEQRVLKGAGQAFLDHGEPADNHGDDQERHQPMKPPRRRTVCICRSCHFRLTLFCFINCRSQKTNQIILNALKRSRSVSTKQLMANLDKSSEAGLTRLSVSAQFAVMGLIGACFAVGVAWILLGTSPSILGGMCLYGVVIALALNGVREGFAHRTIGLCNGATIARLALVSVLVAVLLSGYAVPWAVFGVAVLAFTLDGADGWLARREGRASAFGARFDMEVDSLLALVLALLAWQSGAVGAYVIVLGLPRYVFWGAQFAFPWLNGALPERFSRKVVCVVQITALILALCPLVPAPVASVFAGVAAIALIWSFWVDVRHLYGARG